MITSFFVNLSGSVDVNIDDSGTRRTVNFLIGDLPPVVGEAFTDGLVWLSGLLRDGEEFQQTLVEPCGSSGERRVLSFAVSVTGPLGERTLAITTEQMPEGLRDQILEAVEELDNEQG